MAQKGGAVVSSIILSERPIETASKISYGNADLLLGFDLLGAANAENLRRAVPERTVAVVNTAEIPSGVAVRGLVRLAGPEPAIDVVNKFTDRARNVFVDATRLAEGLFGSHMAVNVFLLGVAYQGGHVRLSAGAIEEAIRLNGAEVERNLAAFLWGRKYFHDARSVEAIFAPPAKAPEPRLGLVEHRTRELRAYQGETYAAQYGEFARRIADRAPALEEPVARYLYKLMAYKDEYEVARLLTRPEFAARIDETWEAVESIGYNLHPPLLRALGWKKKLQFGQWFSGPLRILASLKFLRGTALDPFGYAAVRREERELIGWYRALIEELAPAVTPENAAAAVEIASLPDQIRGYEEIKRRNIARVKKLASEKMSALKLQQRDRVEAR
jgi:indolepyruvate ferredoxin oxidoreductase